MNKSMNDRFFVTYGISEILPEKFVPIKNRPSMFGFCINKPIGGLWACEEYPFGGSAWESWCRSEEFNPERLHTHVTFSLTDATQIYVVDSREDYLRLYEHYRRNDGPILLDFEKMAEDFDGLEFTEQGFSENRFPVDGKIVPPIDTWDVPSLVLFRLDHVEAHQRKVLSKVIEKTIRGGNI